MANSMYDFGRERCLGGDADWDANTIKVTLADAADYIVNLATDDFYNDVTVAGRVATSGALAGKTKTAGVADANDFTYTAVTGDQSEMLVFWSDTGTETTSMLWARIDTATGLPITPNGADINVVFDNGANKIFKL